MIRESSFTGSTLALRTENTNPLSIITPVVIYLVHHPQCTRAARLATRLFRWFRLGDLAGDAAAAGLPVYYRCHLEHHAIQPEINWQQADLNVVIILVDYRMVGDEAWRRAIVDLTKMVKKGPEDRSLLLPVALDESFYQMRPVYDDFNPVRLLGMSDVEMEATLRRAATEATARQLRSIMQARAMEAELRRMASEPISKSLRQMIHRASPPPLDVFLSHAKRDGVPIAEHLRDGVRSFGQLVAWYDANDLPFGHGWEPQMKEAVKKGTAAMVATVTDAYPTRPWCRKEAILARTPQPLDSPSESGDIPSRIWTVQPVVAVHQPGPQWVRGLPMLAGVPRIGWDASNPDKITAQVVDRLVLEMMLVQTHSRVAQALAQAPTDDQSGEYWITWVPDTWTLIALKKELKSALVKRIIYPGHGLSTAEVDELKPALHTLGEGVKLTTYEEVWP